MAKSNMTKQDKLLKVLGLGILSKNDRDRMFNEYLPRVLGQLKSGEDEPLWMNLLKANTKDVRTLPSTMMLPAYEGAEQLGRLSRGQETRQMDQYSGRNLLANLLGAATGGASIVGGAMTEGLLGVGGGLVPQYNWSPEALESASQASFLDEPEREAFKANPERQQAKAMAQVGSRLFGAGINQGTPAAIADKGFWGRVATKGTRQLGPNVMGAFGRAEPYKGESEAGSMIGAGIFSYLAPFLGESAKEIGNKMGIRTSARAQGVPGRTTEDKAANLRLAKEEGVSGITAQGRVDKAMPRVRELAVQKESALQEIPEESLEQIKGNIKTEVNKKVKEAARSSEILDSKAYQKLIERIDTATSPDHLDKIATEFDDLINYNSEKLGSITQNVYKLGRQSIVDTLKNQSGDYKMVKNSLANIYKTTLGDYTLKQAEREVQGITLPLIAGGAEVMAAPKGIFSTLGSLMGGAMQAPGKGVGLMESVLPQGAQSYLTSEAGRLIGGQIGTPERGPTQAPQDIDLSTLPGWGGEEEMGMQPSMGQDMGMGGMGMGDMSGLGGNMPPMPPIPEGAGQPQGPQIDMEKLTMGLVQGVLSGHISGSDAQNILGMMQMIQGPQQEYASDYEPDNLLDAMDYLGQRYPDMPDGTKASVAKSLLEDKTKGLNEYAVSGLHALDQIERLAGDVDFAATGIGAIAKAPFLSLGAASGEDEEARLYRDMKESFLATLARAKGERGVLTDQDVGRVEKALPSFKDSESLTKKKLRESRQLMYEILGITDEEAKELLGIKGQEDGIVDDYDSWMQ